jgi:hypothetical protein
MKVFVPFFISSIVALIVFLVLVSPALARREKRIRQARIDKEIERDLFKLMLGDGVIKALLPHSDHKRLARLIVNRILEYIDMGVAPSKLLKLINALELDSLKVGDGAAVLVHHIRQGVLDEVSGHTLNVYMYTACDIREHEQALEKLNQSFLTRGAKGSFVMNLKLA